MTLLSNSSTVSAINVRGPDGLVARRQGGSWIYYEFDAQGSVSQRLDASGNVLSSSVYDAYGGETNSGTPTDPFGYNAQWGYWLDRDTGLYLCQARWYDPVTARWVTRDPIGYAGGANLYGYCGGGPAGAADPSGLQADRVYGWAKAAAQGIWDTSPIAGLTGSLQDCADAFSAMGQANGLSATENYQAWWWQRYIGGTWDTLSGQSGEDAAIRGWTPIVAGLLAGGGAKARGGLRVAPEPKFNANLGNFDHFNPSAVGSAQTKLRWVEGRLQAAQTYDSEGFGTVRIDFWSRSGRSADHEFPHHIELLWPGNQRHPGGSPTFGPRIPGFPDLSGW